MERDGCVLGDQTVVLSDHWESGYTASLFSKDTLMDPTDMRQSGVSFLEEAHGDTC